MYEGERGLNLDISKFFHGTSRHLFERIMNEGLKPMARQYVHMSVDTTTANMVEKRKDSNPILLKIQGGNASHGRAT